MSCWRVLELSEQGEGEAIPQLLVKPVFTSESYTVYLTDLSNIWCEELNKDGVIARASSEQSPIEVSDQDNAQLSILLDNVKKPIESSKDTTCRITRQIEEGLTLHTGITLPKPLGALTWTHHLKKRTSTTLKNELILPLLVSSHIQHERIMGLVSTIVDKDKAITRLVDQYESSNLDLAAAFPSAGGAKTGRKTISRNQAARHVPALQPFHEDAWRKNTGQLKLSEVTTLGLFQEALVHSTPRVPPELKSRDEGSTWWTTISSRLKTPKPDVKSPVRKQVPPPPPEPLVDKSEDETEDEFETHANFKVKAIICIINYVLHADGLPETAEWFQEYGAACTGNSEQRL